MTNDGGCLEARMELAISMDAYLDEGNAIATLEDDQGITGVIEPKYNFTGRLGRCYLEEAP